MPILKQRWKFFFFFWNMPTNYKPPWTLQIEVHTSFNSPFMKKTLSKNIMKITRIRYKFWGSRKIKKCIQNKETIASLYYNSLMQKIIIYNKKFWKIVKPFLSDKIITHEKITLIENEEIFSNIENEYFNIAT